MTPISYARHNNKTVTKISHVRHNNKTVTKINHVRHSNKTVTQLNNTKHKNCLQIERNIDTETIPVDTCKQQTPNPLKYRELTDLIRCTLLRNAAQWVTVKKRCTVSASVLRNDELCLRLSKHYVCLLHCKAIHVLCVTVDDCYSATNTSPVHYRRGPGG